MSDHPTIGFLGLGIMGAAMARRLVEAGLPVSVYNRTASKMAPLADAGAEACESPADAVRGKDVVVTIPSDGPAVDVMLHDAISEMKKGAIWIQMATVGVEWTDHFIEAARDHDVVLVDAPVLGTKAPAERGELLVLASGPDGAKDACAPIFEAVGKKTLWLGEAGAGSRVKLVVNNWLVGLLCALAESIALADALGVAKDALLTTIAGGPLDVPYAQMKGRAMIDGSFDPSFPLALAYKDARLVIEAAAETGLHPEITEAAATLFARAIEAGHGEKDMAAVYLATKPGDE